ncbi:hypothetical protein [Collinsella aerofaciens]|uniref:hypothetical protein n=1 Tax=Collinsella aerofaciens TaxID=74426 RepID=UPI0034A3A2E5
MKQDEIKKTIIDNVSECAGSAAGAVAGGLIGAAIGGPEGAAAGSVAATAIEHMFQTMGCEIKKRTLAPLEEQRVGTVYAKAKELIEEKIAQGKTPRNDIFFDKDSSSRPSSEELLEGTLLAAQREHEEKKTVYLARLYANILFHPEISRPTANHLVKLAEQLTYRQIAILNNIATMQFARTLNPPINPLKKSAYESVSGTENVAIAAEIFDLYRMSILGSSQVILDAGGINPSTLTVVGYGAHLYNLMDLGSMEPDPELIEIQASIMLFLIGTKQRQ